MTHNLKKGGMGSKKRRKRKRAASRFPHIEEGIFPPFLGCRAAAAAAAVCRSLASPLTQIINPHGGGGRGKTEERGKIRFCPIRTSRIRRTKGVETTFCLYALRESGEFLVLSTLASRER